MYFLNLLLLSIKYYEFSIWILKIFAFRTIIIYTVFKIQNCVIGKLRIESKFDSLAMYYVINAVTWNPMVNLEYESKTKAA